MSLKPQLLHFVETNLLRGGSGQLTEDDSLIDRGLIDSLGLMHLMLFVEENTGLKIPDTEVVPENFQSVAHIDALVSRLRAPKVPAV